MVNARGRAQPVWLYEGLTWCLDDLSEPNDSDQPDSTAAEPLEGPPVPRCCSHSSAGLISTTNICCSLPDTCFTLSRQTAPNKPATTTTASEQQRERLVCQVVSKNPRKDQPGFFFLPPQTQSRRCAASPRQSSGSHIVKTAFCVHVYSLKGRQQIPQWGAATGGDMLWAVCVCVCVLSHSLSLSARAVLFPPRGHQEATNSPTAWPEEMNRKQCASFTFLERGDAINYSQE